MDTRDAPPGLTWTELVRQDGMAAEFDGPAISSLRWLFGLGALAGAIGTIAVMVTSLTEKSMFVGWIFLLLFGLAALGFLYSAMTGGPSAGRFEVDGKELRVVPDSMLILRTTIPLASLEYFTIEDRREDAEDLGKINTGAERWYKVQAMTSDRGFVAVASFADQWCASFVCDRLGALVADVRLRVG